MSPAVKRRKVDHVSDEEEDAASFTSFGSSESGEKGTGELEDVRDEVDDFSADDSSAASGRVDDTTSAALHGATNGAHDEDMGNGDMDDSAGHLTNQGPAPPKRQTPENKQKKPTNPRVSASALTGGNVKANLFQLQIDGLLDQTRPVRNSRAEAAEKALHDLKGIMEKLPSRGPSPIMQAERDLIKKSRVAVPFPDPRPSHDMEYKLEFRKPASINVIGSYVSNLHLRSKNVIEIDMMVQMPDALFQPKDYQDFRYLYRRSYYLACLAAGIRDASDSEYVIEFCNHKGNPLQPILIVRPGNSVSGSASKWQVNVLPCISPKVFSDDKVLPTKSLIRTGQENKSPEDAPTSLYNSSIQADRETTAYLKLIHSTASSCDGFKDACLLLRIWLRQRGLSSSIQGGGFGGFESTALLAALVSSAVLSERYNTYQLFKATLQYLATKDALKALMVIGQSASTLEHIPNTPIFFDGPRSHNLLYKMTAWSYKSLRAEARNTISMLGDNSSDQFDPTFVLKQDTPHLKFDVALALPSHYLSDQTKSDHEALQSHQKLYETLTRGLGDRVTHIDMRSESPGTWELGSARPSWKTKSDINIFLRLNPANAGRTVDHGPAAEQKMEAAEFRKFWGEKAELRRFKDGSILESVVWPAQETDQKLVVEIVDYLVSRHFGQSTASAVQIMGGDVLRLLPHSGGLAAFQPAMDAFKSLEEDIRSLDGLPLTIRQIFPADEKTRFSSVLLSSAVTPIDVVLQFESSTRWPNSLTAIQRTKTAFLLYLSHLITDSNPELTCKVGLENQSTPVLNQSFLDIFYPSFTFRLRLHHDLELSFLQSQLKSPQLSPPQREATALALAAYKRTFILHPSHTAYIAKLSTTFPALSPTIRLLKLWFSSHLLASHFPPALIELLALRAFLLPHPYPVPSSAKTGFFRTLSFLSRWDWRTTPLLLPPPTDLDSITREVWTRGSRTRFEAWRKLDPASHRVVLFVAYHADPEGTAWTDLTQGGPGKVVVGRMTALARAAAEEIEKPDMDPRKLFVSGTGDYDFVIRLSDVASRGAKKKAGKANGRGKSGFKNLELDAQGIEEVGFEPATEFLDELRGAFGGAVVLFHGAPGGGVIGGLWNPVTEKRGWKVGLGYSSVPVTEGGEALALINKKGILGEMARLGGEMVERIEVKGGL